MRGWGRQRAVTPRASRGVSLGRGGMPWGQVRWPCLLWHRGWPPLQPVRGGGAGSRDAARCPLSPEGGRRLSPSLCCGYTQCSVIKKPAFTALNMERSCGCLKKKVLYWPAR